MLVDRWVVGLQILLLCLFIHYLFMYYVNWYNSLKLLRRFCPQRPYTPIYISEWFSAIKP